MVRLARSFSLLLSLSVVAGSALGASLSDIPPGVIAQVKSMPPAQAQALARQYGIDLGTLAGAEAAGPAPGQAPAPIASDQATAPAASDQPAAPGQQATTPSEAEARAEAKAAPAIEPLDPETRFGLGFFSAEVSTFAPVDNVPVPQDYRLGPGDELRLLMLGQDNAELSLVIDRLGEIALPQMGKLALAGMTFEAAAALVQKRIAAERIGVEALVSMGRLRAINVMLAGEVRVPGARSLSALSRLTHALFAAGGLSPVGSLRSIQVKRDGETVGVFDAYDLMLEGDTRGDLQLRDGDVVFVPTLTRLGGVSGAVRRPGVFELAEGETLADLLAMAGGATARGLSEGMLLERERPNGGPEILVLNAGDLAAQEALTGDRLRVQVASQRFSNRVVLEGAVQRPGVYGHFEGMRLSDLLRDVEIDLLENTDLGYGLVVSTEAHTGLISVVQFSPSAVLASPEGPDDLLLASRDRVLIFTRTNSGGTNREALLAPVIAQLDRQASPEAPLRAVSIAGAVQAPGRYPLGSGLRLSDLLAAAGGPLETTDLGYGLVVSTEARTGLISVSQFAPSEVFAAPAGAEDTALQPRDRVLIFTRTNSDAPNREALLGPVLAQLDRQANPDSAVPAVTISGAVQAPGRYPLGEGYTAADLLNAAGGFRDDAYRREIEIQTVFLNRQSVAEVRVRTVSGEGAALAQAALESRDRVLVRTIPDWQSTETVELAGEFRFPGTYNLLPGETLGELIDRAGGVTYEAFPYGAVYTARTAAEAEQEEMRRFVTEIRRTYASSSLTQQQQMASYGELEQAIAGLTERDSLGRIAIDLPRILAGDRGADLPLSDGDRIFLPRRNESITVLGEVFRPGSFRFEAGQSLRDYLALGAGTTVRADEGKIYIVRADGRVDRPGRSLLRFGLGQTALRPGDTIIVPLDASYRDPLNFWTEITQVAFQTGIAVAAVLRN